MSESNIHFEEVPHGDVVVLRITDKRLDNHRAPAFKAHLLKITEAYHRIVVNLEQVTFVDSSGLGSLLFGRRLVEEQKGDLKLCYPQRRVTSLLHISQLDKVFEIYPNEKAAVESFGKNQKKNSKD
jgi:anti-anti-sigma factor